MVFLEHLVSENLAVVSWSHSHQPHRSTLEKQGRLCDSSNAKHQVTLVFPLVLLIMDGLTQLRKLCSRHFADCVCCFIPAQEIHLLGVPHGDFIGNLGSETVPLRVAELSSGVLGCMAGICRFGVGSVYCTSHFPQL